MKYTRASSGSSRMNRTYASTRSGRWSVSPAGSGSTPVIASRTTVSTTSSFDSNRL